MTRQPFRRILLLRRHRRPSDQLLAGAADLARRCGSSLTFAHALEGVDRIAASSRSELLSELRSTLEPHLEGLAADYLLLDGDLSAAAERVEHHDLIIPAEGGPGSEGERRELDRLLRRSPLPVWLDSRAGHSPEGILAAVDLQTRNPVKRELNPRIVRAAASLASRLGARLDLLSVRAPVATSDRLIHKLAGREAGVLSRRETRERMRSLLTEALDGLSPLASEPRLLVAQGDPDTLIAQAAEAASIDLLVAGCVGRGGLAGWLVGDTTQRLTRRLPCSILAVKPSASAPKAQRRDDHSRAA